MKWRRQFRIPAIVKQRARNYWDNRITICDKTKQRDKTNSETFKISSCHVFRVKRKKRIGAKWASLQCSSSCNPLTSEKRKSKLAASSNCRPPWHEPSTASGRLFHVASYLSNMRQPVEWICFLFHGMAILLVCVSVCVYVCVSLVARTRTVRPMANKKLNKPSCAYTDASFSTSSARFVVSADFRWSSHLISW